MGKKESEKNKELAKVYFMEGDTQAGIAQRLGVSRTSVARWVNEGAWAEQRSAKSLTRKEIVQKLLLKLHDLSQRDDLNTDAISKVAAAIERIDKKTNIVTIIEVLEAYNRWFVARMRIDKEITPELLKIINRYQDLFISEQFNSMG